MIRETWLSLTAVIIYIATVIIENNSPPEVGKAHASERSVPQRWEELHNKQLYYTVQQLVLTARGERRRINPNPNPNLYISIVIISIYYTALLNAVERCMGLPDFQNNPLQSEARHLNFASVSCSPCQVLFPDNDQRSIHYPLHDIIYYLYTCFERDMRRGFYSIPFYSNRFYSLTQLFRKHGPRTTSGPWRYCRWSMEKQNKI